MLTAAGGSFPSMRSRWMKPEIWFINVHAKNVQQQWNVSNNDSLCWRGGNKITCLCNKDKHCLIFDNLRLCVLLGQDELDLVVVVCKDLQPCLSDQHLTIWFFWRELPPSRHAFYWHCIGHIRPPRAPCQDLRYLCLCLLVNCLGCQSCLMFWLACANQTILHEVYSSKGTDQAVWTLHIL